MVVLCCGPLHVVRPTGHHPLHCVPAAGLSCPFSQQVTSWGSQGGILGLEGSGVAALGLMSRGFWDVQEATQPCSREHAHRLGLSGGPSISRLLSETQGEQTMGRRHMDVVRGLSCQP